MGKDLDNIVTLYVENKNKTEILKAYERIVKRLTLLAKQSQELETAIRIENSDIVHGLLELLKIEGFGAYIKSYVDGFLIQVYVPLHDIYIKEGLVLKKEISNN